MACYVVFTTLTSQGRKRVHADPGRVREVTRIAEHLGARVTAQYATLGPYDFVTIIEAEDNAAVQLIQSEIAGLGTTRMVVAPAIGMHRFVKLLEMQPYRTEPHRWQTSLWARTLRRTGRHWVMTRHVKRYCKPLNVEGIENLANHKGGAIVIANHSSHFDTPVVLAALPERIRNRIIIAAAADKFYASRKKRTWWYSLFHGTFPVARGGGVKQLEYPLSLLKRKWSLLIYPEGGRSKSGQVQRFKVGPTIMAMQAHVPVIPLYIEGLREVMPKGARKPRPASVSVRIGAPVSVEGVTSVSDGTKMLENAMRELAGMPPHHQPVPAVPDTELAMASASGGGA
ncbi:MAG: 1-acyl-sn-glycerol-3-phosphate acyltransferase [Dehalococcoidia bacterium]